uniref:PKD/REJ-like domain-containing protein n=2 Tax=Scylla olivacea TaxID=85551 RepID=A0A0P4W127_SCYOL
MLSQYPITRSVELLAYEFYAYSLDTFTAKVVRPDCGGLVYSLANGECVLEDASDVTDGTTTCSAPQLICFKSVTCVENTCAAASTPPVYGDVPGSEATVAVTVEGFQRLKMSAPVALQRGDVVVVQGPLGRSPEDYENGDTVDGIPSSFHHYVEVIVKEAMPVEVPHKCVTVNLDVILEVVDDDVPANVLTNHTSCERNITDVSLQITQTETDEYDPSLNVADPFYVRSNRLANYTVAFSVGGPINLKLSYDPNFGSDDLFDDTGDFPLGSELHELTYELQRSNDLCYVITIEAWNQHNEASGPITNTTNLCVQHEVLTTWTMTSDSVSSSFKIPSQAASFLFEMSSPGNFPTNASVDVTWGDGSFKETLPFEDSGGDRAIISHNYTEDGYYNVTAYIYNNVSGFEVSCQVKIVEEIVGFEIHPKYISSLGSERDGYGRTRNQYPLTKNVSFFPHMTQGTVTYYRVAHSINDSEIMTFTTIDEFEPLANAFHYHFSFETFLNLTVTAYNEFESVSVDLFLEIVGKVRGCQLSDFNLVTAKGEGKTLQVTFESVGGGTCLLVNYGDSMPLVPHAFGDDFTCSTEYPHATYSAAPELDVALNFTHVYMEEGIYNLTIIAYNELSNCSSSITSYVSNIRCNPPTVNIMSSTMDVEAPLQFTYSDGGIIFSDASINCEVTSNTKKRWQVYHADPLTAAFREAVIIMHEWKSWDKPELVIPKFTLDYGFYLATYTLTMWDPDVLPDHLPLQRIAVTLFEIIPSPLIAILMPGSVSKVARGLTQEISLKPCELSIDPDFPEDKNFTITWSCRKIGEDWPNPDPGPTSIWEAGTGGGCFGNGPGTLQYSLCELSIMGSDFKDIGTYEIEVLVSKDERSRKASLQIEIVDGLPPILSMECASPGLCITLEDGVLVNPCKRIGIVADCVDACEELQQYEWEAVAKDGMQFPYNDAHFPNGYNDIQLMFSSQFFMDYPSVTSLHISLKATTTGTAVGESTYFFKVNQKPKGGTCVLQEMGQSRALIDSFFVECEGWMDPDEHGIKNYVITCKNLFLAIISLFFSYKVNHLVCHYVQIFIPITELKNLVPHFELHLKL